MVLDPGRIAVAGEILEAQEGYGEPDDGRLVQLRRDGRRQRKHLGQFVEFVVLLAAPRARRVLALLLHLAVCNESTNRIVTLCTTHTRALHILEHLYCHHWRLQCIKSITSILLFI